MIHPRLSEPDAHPYLRAATAGVRHHARALSRAAPPDRGHLDTLHAHLTELHRFIAQLAEVARPLHPAAGRHLATAHTRLWQATTEIHAAFHVLPGNTAQADTETRPPSTHHGLRAMNTTRRIEGPR